MIEFQNVSKKLGKFQLQEISFELPKGYIMGLVGPNGAGKTSLIHLMLGLYQPSQGMIHIFGNSFEEEPEAVLNKIGTVLSEELFDGDKNLLQNAAEYGQYYKEYSEETLKKYLVRFELEEKCKYKKMSRGEKLKFQFAFALSHHPQLLILDEPTGNFDPQFREEFFKVLKEFIADGTKSVVLATHLTEDLDKVADYILYLEKGKSIFAGDIETLRDSYRMVAGEEYKVKLIRKEKIIHMEKGKFGTKALVEHTKRSIYDKSLTVTIPSIEEIMYFMTKRGR